MNSRDLSNQDSSDQAEPFVSYSSTLTMPISEPFDAQILNIQKIEIIEESLFAAIGDFLEKKIYKNIISKATEHILNAFKRLKIFAKSSDRFYQQRFIEDINYNIDCILDQFDIWVGYNILRRKVLLEYKKRILEKEEKKKKRIEEIKLLMSNIIEKQKDKKAEDIIELFQENRKKNYVKYVPYPEIKTYRQRINRVMTRKSRSTKLEFQKVEEEIKAFKKEHQDQSNFRFTDKFDKLKIF